MTAAVWLRGLFEHEYGIPPSEIHWIQAGEEQPGRKDRVDFEMPPGVRMDSKSDRTLNEMIVSGEIDAMMSPRMPTCFLEGAPNVRRLFPNYRQAEMDYFAKTGLFPIMHVIVIRRAIYKRIRGWPKHSIKRFVKLRICACESFMTPIFCVSACPMDFGGI